MRYIVKTEITLCFDARGAAAIVHPDDAGEIIDFDIPKAWLSDYKVAATVEDLMFTADTQSTPQGSRLVLTASVITRFDGVKDRKQLEALMDDGWITWPEEMEDADGEGIIWWLDHKTASARNEIVAEYA